MELARQHGVYSVAHPLRLDYMGLKKRLEGVPESPEEGSRAGIRRTDRRASGDDAGVRDRVRVLDWQQDAHSVEELHCTGLGKPASCLAGSGAMIHITAQMRVLVAIESVDGRKGIDSLVRVCQDKLSEDPITGCVFILPEPKRNVDSTA